MTGNGRYVGRRIIAADTETHLIRPGCIAPRLVCLTHAERGKKAALLDRAQALAWAFETLADPDVVIVWHHGPFDWGVLCTEAPALMPMIFRAIEDGRLVDTMVRQKLIDIARGELEFRRGGGRPVKTEHTLAALADHWLGRYMAKGEDTWRTRYGELDGVPISEWPPEAVRYPLDDAEATLDVFYAQEMFIQDNFGDSTLPNEVEQVRAAWALHLMSMWGIRTDGAAVAQLKDALEGEQQVAIEELRKIGFIRTALNKKTGLPTKQDGTKDTAAIQTVIVESYKARYLAENPGTTADDLINAQDAAVRANGVDGLKMFWTSIGVPLTETGRVKMDDETLRATDDPRCLLLAQSGSGAKLLSTYVPILERGAQAPINAAYNVLVASGRTSCSNPNMQNPPRKGGVRECFIARPSRLFADVDYDTLELRSLSQVCLDLFGWSAMADALRRGEDLHVRLASEMLGIPFSEAQQRYDAGDKEIEDARQFCKIGNFGFPGGMSWETFVEYAKGYGIIVPRDRAIKLKKAWDSAWPEMKEYFKYIGNCVGSIGEGVMEQVRSGRIRGGLHFCAGANTLFQGLAADGAKEALWQVAAECYLKSPGKILLHGLHRGDGKSALYGSRPLIFMHDEIIAEVPDVPGHPEVAAAAAERLAQVMRESMQRWIPDVPIGAKPSLMRKWYKGAKPVYSPEGILLPSRPEKRTKDGKEVTVWIADMPDAEVQS